MNINLSKIKNLRIQNNMSLNSLSTLCGVDIQVLEHLEQFENNTFKKRVPEIPLKTLERIASVLHVKINDLIQDGMKIVKSDIGENYVVVPEGSRVIVCGRDIIYCPFSSEKVQKNLKEIEKNLSQNIGYKVTLEDNRQSVERRVLT